MNATFKGERKRKVPALIEATKKMRERNWSDSNRPPVDDMNEIAELVRILAESRLSIVYPTDACRDWITTTIKKKT